MRRFKKIMTKDWFLLAVILFLALSLRLYKINIPLADHHSWRQADTAAVARNFVKEGFDFLHPKIDNMAPLHPGVLNSGRLFLVEPPVYQTVVLALYKIFGVKEYLARLVALFFSLGAIVFLYLLVEKLTNKWIGLLAAFFMAVLPYSIFYSRVVMPEPLMIFACLGMLYWFEEWLTKGRGLKEGILVWFFAALALALKSFPPFLSLSMLYLAWRKYRFNLIQQRRLWIFAFFSVLPLVLWRIWVSRSPEGIPAFEWLLNGGIRFRPAFFRWIFAERIGKLILGYWGLPLLVLGLVLRPGKKEGWFFHWWLISFFAYVAIFASGNVTHDYYQTPFVPIASIFLAKGSYWLLRAPRRDYSRLVCCWLFVVCCLFMLGFSWFEVRGFYLIQGGVDLAGQAVNSLAPEGALVLAGDSNDATLLYNCNRYGWTGGYASYFPNTSETIEEVRRMGATVYVTTKFDQTSGFGEYMLENYPILRRSDQYVVFSLVTQSP